LPLEQPGLAISNLHLNIYILAGEREEQQPTSKAIGFGGFPTISKLIFNDEPEPCVAVPTLVHSKFSFAIMDPGQAPPPRLRVILDHRTKNSDGITSVTVWNPGDKLQGRLELSSTEDLHIGKIAIYFEGGIQAMPIKP
jgi:hypothetical protein